MEKEPLDYLERFRQEFEKSTAALAHPEIFKDKEEYQRQTRRYAFLKEIMRLLEAYKDLKTDREGVRDILGTPAEDEAVLELARQELASLEAKLAQTEREFYRKVSESRQGIKSFIVEIRAGTGGQEAALFAGDLFRMYSKYILNHSGWKVEVLNASGTELGGYKEVIFSVRGESAFLYFKFESGVHRVQRVPVTEAGGRIHTSTATVAVLKEPDEIELKIEPKDLQIETCRASGAGGQHVNKTESAIRLLHIPSGITVSCQDERSQMKNREKAMRVLRARLLSLRNSQEEERLSKERKGQIGAGERSEKIRTYNFPQNRLTDHRVDVTLYNLSAILEGNLDDLIQPLILAEREQVIESFFHG
jgi:peptide chain release factor 1